MNAPNTMLRAARLSMRLSQDDLARELRAAGARSGYPNDATKRLVQRWESGAIATPRPAYARALEVVMGLPIEQLGFPVGVDAIVVDDGQGGHDLRVRGNVQPAGPSHGAGSYNGIWLSRYEYYSSGRDEALVGRHYAVLLQHGNQLTVRSLPGSAESTMSMELVVDGNAITGTWREQTNPEGYYRGATYFGAIQLLGANGRRLTGKWVGFGSELDINTGPWQLTLQDQSTSKATLDRYNRPPSD